MLIGSIVHEIFQTSIKLKDINMKKLQQLATEIVFKPDYLPNM